MYDYGWRHYMADLGRWNGIDQLAEMYVSTSTYAYVANNPVMRFDVDGRWFNDDGTIDTSGRTPSFVTGKQYRDSFLGVNRNDGSGSVGGGGSWGQSFTSNSEPTVGDLIDAWLNNITTDEILSIASSMIDDITDPRPKRKYLKKRTNAYFGAIESTDQYQIDHEGWTDEYQGTMEFLGSLKEYFDSAGSHLGGVGYGGLAIDNIKTIKEVFEKFKGFNPSLASAASAIMGVVGTSISMEGDRFGQIMDIYKNADYRYDQLHKKIQSLIKG